MKRKLPVLKGFIYDRQIYCWCPFCQKFHIHGWRKNTSLVKIQYGEYRIALCCDEDSPFKLTGYYVKPYANADLVDSRIN